MSAWHAAQQANPFLTAPIGRLFVSNAVPMAIVMSMGGALHVVDGIFVGRFIGSDALAAVSIAFPFAMVLSALTVLVGGGMSSLMARYLGAGDRLAAGRILAGAHGLALAISAGLAILWIGLGSKVVVAMAAGNPTVAGLAQDYLGIIILGAPLQLILGIHADAARNEGRAGLVAVLSVLVNLFNIVANWMAIVVLGLGVTGSALGTVAAQTLGVVLVLCVRGRSHTLLPLSVLRDRALLRDWPRILRLGLPLCLSLVGIAIVSSVVMLALRLHAEADYATAVAAYGVVTRFLTFAYLPQMAVALTMQSIAGNNAGAGQTDRARAALRMGMVTALVWCLAVTIAGVFFGAAIGSSFSAEPAVIDAIAEILRPMMLLYVSSGPILVLALYFQALGQPGRTAALTLVKPWLLTPFLILAFSAALGVSGIWLAFPIADALTLLLAFRIGRKVLGINATRPLGAEQNA